MSAFEVGRAPTRTFTRSTATTAVAATVCVSVVADGVGDCDSGD